MKLVKYTGCSQDQINWGGNDDPRDILEVGKTYEVEKTHVHSWHTKTKLKNIDGWFNSVCFDSVKAEAAE